MRKSNTDAGTTSAEGQHPRDVYAVCRLAPELIKARPYVFVEDYSGPHFKSWLKPN